MDRIGTKVKCPECGHEQNHTVDIKASIGRPEVTVCGPEDGGCDCYFAVQSKLHLTAEVFKMETVG